MDNMGATTVLASITPVLVAIVGYFLKQSLNNVQILAEEIKKVVAIVQAHTTGLAVIESKYTRIESDINSLKARYDELAGFLHGHGFARRGGKSECD